MPKKRRLSMLKPRMGILPPRLGAPKLSPSSARRVRGRRLQLLRSLAIAERGCTCEHCHKIKPPSELVLHHRDEGGLAGAVDGDPFADDVRWRDAAELICISCHDAEHGVRTIGPDGWPV
jgi:hypothetical protein